MSYLGGNPILNTTRTRQDGAATTDGQQVIPVPSGFIQGMVDVVVGGALLGLGDFDDSTPNTIMLVQGMAKGTQYSIIAWSPNQSITAPGAGTAYPERNIVMNGDMLVGQRSTQTLTGNAQAMGGADRWQSLIANSAGGTVDLSRAALTMGGSRIGVVCKATVPPTTIAGNALYGGLHHIVEGNDCYDLGGVPLAVSFLFKASGAGTYTVALRDGASNYSFLKDIVVAAGDVGVLKAYAFLVPTLPTGGLWGNGAAAGFRFSVGALNQGTYQTAATGGWISGNYLASTAQTNWASTGATITLSDVKIQPGVVVTPYVRRPMAAAVRDCERYFKRFGGASGAAIAIIPGTSYTSAPLCGQQRTAVGLATNMTDANFANGVANGANQWGLVANGVAYTSRTAGAFNFTSIGGNPCIGLYGMTLSNSPTMLQLGAGIYVDSDAEIYT